MKIESRYEHRLARIEDNRKAIQYLLRHDNTKASVKPIFDTYAKTAEDEYSESLYLNYSKGEIGGGVIVITTGYLSPELLRQLNDFNLSISVSEMVHCRNMYFTIDSIPEVPECEFEEIKAIDNVVDFGKSNYFKFSSNGKEYHMYCSTEGSIGRLMSETLCKIHNGIQESDVTDEQYGTFWNMLRGGVQEGLMNISRTEQKKYLDEMGVEHGFFTVRMGDRENTLYRTRGKHFGEAVDKTFYDEEYERVTKGEMYRNIILENNKRAVKIDGVEYEFDENGNLDVPYGADIFDLEFCDD